MSSPISTFCHLFRRRASRKYLAMLINRRFHVAKTPTVAIFIFSSILLVGWYSRHNTKTLYHDGQKPGSVWDVKNSTLGFERIFVLSLPERTDKRDSISVAASVTGFTLEFVDGVKGDMVSPKAMPKNWDPSLDANTLGCWRGHIDIAQKMVREGVQSALLFEDDADWDVMFKDQLYEFAKGARVVQQAEGPQYSPYGDDWDVLWFGHCGVSLRPADDQAYYLIPNDPTVAPMEKRYGSQPEIPTALKSNSTRYTFRGVAGRCLTGYGLSLRGAQRLLFKESMTRATSIDRGIAGLCSQAKGDFECIATWPAMVGTFKDAGDVSKDSDRVSVKGEPRKYASTRDIAYPVRLNIDRFLKKHPTFRPQWTEEGGTLPEISRKTIMPKGRREWVTTDMYPKKKEDKKQ